MTFPTPTSISNEMVPHRWLTVRPEGLYCIPGDFYVDPSKPVGRAAITHGHGDHARPGNHTVLATEETLNIARSRYGDDAAKQEQSIRYGENLRVGNVDVSFHPAGHILGSAQIQLTYRGCRIVISGDYKRRWDPTCVAFEPQPCEVFITEATFGLPVFTHPDDILEIGKLLRSVATFPDRCHLVGVYALGKAQRVIALLRHEGYQDTIYLHGALQDLCDLYQNHGVDLGSIAPIANTGRQQIAGRIVLCPPSALNDRWARKFPDPVTAMASGWMRVRQRARQRNIELPLILSDHADWNELTQTLRDVDATEVWVTHGREEALVHQAKTMGFNAKALSVIGFGGEAEDSE